MCRVHEKESLVYRRLMEIRELLLSANVLIRDTLVQEVTVLLQDDRVLIREVLDSFNLICFRSLKLCLLSDIDIYTSSMICTVRKDVFIILSRLLPAYISLNVLDINSWLGTTTFSVTVDTSSVEDVTDEVESLGYYLYRYIKVFDSIKRLTENYFMSKVYESDINANTSNLGTIVHNFVLDCLFKVEFGKTVFRHPRVLTNEDKVLFYKIFNTQIVCDGQNYIIVI